jgi:hypothetical protein
MADVKAPTQTEKLEDLQPGFVRVNVPGHGWHQGTAARAVLPAKTMVPGVGVVGCMDGYWIPSLGFAFVKSNGSRGTIVHPAQGLITLLEGGA